MRRLGMSRRVENTGFTCVNCGMVVVALTNGSYRNHCPYCLFSLHLDDSVGDRQSYCFGQMKLIEVVYNSKKAYQIVHECQKCKVKRLNRIAENTEMPDDFNAILKLFNMSK
jgi:DNA-directed RNA polymerase subunit RPC12/RpoP